MGSSDFHFTAMRSLLRSRQETTDIFELPSAQFILRCGIGRNIIITVVIVIVNTKTRNSSGNEIANVNFLYDDIVRALRIQ